MGLGIVSLWMGLGSVSLWMGLWSVSLWMGLGSVSLWMGLRWGCEVREPGQVGVATIEQRHQ